MKINSITSVQCNNIEQKQPARQECFLMSHSDDEFVKHPSFGAKAEVEYFVELYTDAIKKSNVPFLKQMIEEHNWLLFKEHRPYFENFVKEIKPIIEQGLHSKNKDIKALFSDENLYNLLSQYPKSTILATENGEMFDLAKMYFAKTKDPEARKVIAEDMVYRILNQKTEKKSRWQKLCYSIFNNPLAKKLSQFPLTDFERYFSRLKKDDVGIQKILELAMNARLKSIVSRNGINTPEKLLNCLNDEIMSPEILEMKYKGKELIYRISDISVNDDNKETVSKIAAKLAEMKLPDNETFKTAGVRAAYNGNEEILKAFNSAGVHYMDNIVEPISKFPENVHEVLNNAKINDSTLTSYVNFPEDIEAYLAKHPNVDINSRDNNGDTLVLKAVKEQNFETLKMLAKRDDVDWNAVDKDQKNLLIQMLALKGDNSDLKPEYSIKFAKKLLKLLRKLPQGKFDINYANYFSYLSRYGCFFTLSNFKDDVLAFPDFNPMMKIVNDSYSNLVERCSVSDDLLKKIAAHPNCDPNFVTKLGPKLVLTKELLNDPDLQFAKKMNDIYDKNGSLDLREIEMFIDYFAKDNHNINHRFNIVEENIAHLLVDITPDSSNPNEMKTYKNLFKKLGNKDTRFNFYAEDIFGRTPLDKAIECENETAFNILLIYTES